MESFEIDAYAPAQMAARVEKAGIIKGNLDFISTFTLAVLAGALIALWQTIVSGIWSLPTRDNGSALCP